MYSHSLCTNTVEKVCITQSIPCRALIASELIISECREYKKAFREHVCSFRLFVCIPTITIPPFSIDRGVTKLKSPDDPLFSCNSVGDGL